MRNKYVLFAYLQVLDLLTTLIFLKQGTQEGNPIARWGIEHWHVFPLWPMLAFKVVLISAWLWIVFRITSPAQQRWVMSGSNVVGALVVLNNLGAIYLGVNLLVR
jgi:Domain of unknown function (DUF5658)